MTVCGFPVCVYVYLYGYVPATPVVMVLAGITVSVPVGRYSVS